MVVLVGKNLGERQRELNTKVAEIVASKTSFDEIKNEEEETDVDKLIKIDVAAKYRNIDYIVEVLKSGDSLHISRALKTPWLYDEEWSYVVNTENLHANIFPHMSLKMKKKTLSSISRHVRDPERASNFFSYCIKNKLTSNAYKFLNFTSEEFKLNIFKDKQLNIMQECLDEPKRIKDFVGTSFALAAECVAASWNKNSMLDNLWFMYSVSSEKYLDLLEKHYIVSLDHYPVFQPFGLRISKDIMIKSKKRVLGKPSLYVFKVNKSVLMKYSTSEDAKKYASLLVPSNAKEFWNLHGNSRYSFIYNVIPENERFEFVKHLFTTNYPDEPFEMSVMFYNLGCYSLMTAEERNLWALRHIERGEELLGKGKDYLWYEFVNYDKAFTEIKKILSITPNSDIRSEILKVLIKSAKDQRDLIKLLDYYYERHVNESYFGKQEFLETVIDTHNVFKYDEDCWTALNKLLCSLDVYAVGRHSNKSFEAMAIIFHILHKLDMPQKLNGFLELDINFSYFSNYLDKLGKEKSEIVFQYILNFSIQKLKPFEQDPNNKKLGKTLKQYVNNIWTLLSCFRKDEDKDCPEIVKRFMSIHSPTEKEVTANDIFRLLKQDASRSLEALSHFNTIMKDSTCTKNSIIKKLRIYFFNDIAKQYVKTLYNWISNIPQDCYEYRVIDGVVFALFELGDEGLKKEFLEKYVPTDSGIDHLGIHHSETGSKLYVQEAICRFMGYSRPPIPLENVLQYMKRDYVHYCLPLFNMYMANLPLPLVVKFTESLLNAPVSVQKHGLRLAFKCYSTESLKKLLLNVWNKTKSISLRMILYKSLFYKILAEDEDTRIELYEILKFFTSRLNQDDDQEIFTLMVHDDIPNKFKDDYLRTTWDMVSKLPEKPVNIRRRSDVVDSLKTNIHLVQRDFLRKCILDEHVRVMLEDKRLRTNEIRDIEALNVAKWRLTEKYIVHCANESELKESLKLLEYIVTKSLGMWDDVYENKFISRRFLKEFISNIMTESSHLTHDYIIPILRNILDLLQAALTLKEIYFYVWDLRLSIIVKNILRVSTTRNDGGDLSRKLPVKEICANFANEVKILVEEFKEKQQYYASSSPMISKSIKRSINNLRYALHEDLILDFCEALVNLGEVETHILVLRVMPIDVERIADTSKYNKSKHTHKAILQNLREFDNDEVQILLNSLFYQNDYKNVLGDFVLC